jgi:hypothetical protein
MFGPLALATVLTTGAMQAAAANEPVVPAHPLPKAHDMTTGEAARFVAQKAAGVCDHAEFIVLGPRLRNAGADHAGRLHLSTLFINAGDRQNCTLMLTPEDRGAVPKNLIYVMRDGSALNNRKSSPLTAPKIELTEPPKP